MSEVSKYCNACDQETAEWVPDDYENIDLCPSCFGVLWESQEAYIEEMVRWLPKRAEIEADEVRDFLISHGNPGKGQAMALLR